MECHDIQIGVDFFVLTHWYVTSSIYDLGEEGKLLEEPVESGLAITNNSRFVKENCLYDSVHNF